MTERKRLIDGNEANFLIDKCEFCGFASYNVITECPKCGNKIITVEEVRK